MFVHDFASRWSIENCFSCYFQLLYFEKDSNGGYGLALQVFDMVLQPIIIMNGEEKWEKLKNDLSSRCIDLLYYY